MQPKLAQAAPTAGSKQREGSGRAQSVKFTRPSHSSAVPSAASSHKTASAGCFLDDPDAVSKPETLDTVYRMKALCLDLGFREPASYGELCEALLSLASLVLQGDSSVHRNRLSQHSVAPRDRDSGDLLFHREIYPNSARNINALSQSMNAATLQFETPRSSEYRKSLVYGFRSPGKRLRGSQNAVVFDSRPKASPSPNVHFDKRPYEIAANGSLASPRPQPQSALRKSTNCQSCNLQTTVRPLGWKSRGQFRTTANSSGSGSGSGSTMNAEPSNQSFTSETARRGELERELEAYRSRFEDLKSTAAARKAELDRENKDLLISLSKAQSQNEELSLRLKAAEKERNELEEERQKSQQDNEMLKAALQDSSYRVHELSRTLHLSQRRGEDISALLAEEGRKSEALHQQLEEMQQRQQEADELSSESKRAKKEKKKEKRRASTLGGEKSKHVVSPASPNEREQDMSAQLGELNAECSRLQEENQKLDSTVKQLKDKLTAAERDRRRSLSVTTSPSNLQQQKLENLQKELQTVRESNESLQAAKESLSSTLQEKKRRLNDVSRTLKSSQETLQQRDDYLKRATALVNSHKAEIDRQASLLSDLESQNEQLSKQSAEASALREKLLQAQKLLDESEREQITFSREAAARRAALEKEIDYLSRVTADQGTELERLRVRETEVISDQLSQLERERLERDGLEQTLRDRDSEVSKLKAELERLEQSDCQTRKAYTSALEQNLQQQKELELRSSTEGGSTPSSFVFLDGAAAERFASREDREKLQRDTSDALVLLSGLPRSEAESLLAHLRESGVGNGTGASADAESDMLVRVTRASLRAFSGTELNQISRILSVHEEEDVDLLLGMLRQNDSKEVIAFGELSDGLSESSLCSAAAPTSIAATSAAAPASTSSSLSKQFKNPASSTKPKPSTDALSPLLLAAVTRLLSGPLASAGDPEAALRSASLLKALSAGDVDLLHRLTSTFEDAAELRTAKAVLQGGLAEESGESGVLRAMQSILGEWDDEQRDILLSAVNRAVEQTDGSTVPLPAAPHRLTGLLNRSCESAALRAEPDAEKKGEDYDYLLCAVDALRALLSEPSFNSYRGEKVSDSQSAPADSAQVVSDGQDAMIDRLQSVRDAMEVLQRLESSASELRQRMAPLRESLSAASAQVDSLSAALETERKRSEALESELAALVRKSESLESDSLALREEAESQRLARASDVKRLEAEKRKLESDLSESLETQRQLEGRLSDAKSSADSTQLAYEGRVKELQREVEKLKTRQKELMLSAKRSAADLQRAKEEKGVALEKAKLCKELEAQNGELQQTCRSLRSSASSAQAVGGRLQQEIRSLTERLQAAEAKAEAEASEAAAPSASSALLDRGMSESLLLLEGLVALQARQAAELRTRNGELQEMIASGDGGLSPASDRLLLLSTKRLQTFRNSASSGFRKPMV